MIPMYYDNVPKGYVENLEYRKKILKAAADNVSIQERLMEACRVDTLYFLNAMCWLFEPRPGKDEDGNERQKIIPFITWPHQDKAILTIEEYLGFEDIGVEKARGEGASWISLMIFLKRFLVDPYSAFGLVSRNELAVDNPDDPDSLFWKIDFQLAKLPNWMAHPTQFDRNITRHIIKNRANGSTIVGYSATGDVASGGRKTAFLMDELAKFPAGADEDAMNSTQPVTNCRLLVSTPRGPENAYAKAMVGEDSSMIKIILDWKDNPTRNRGMYRLIDGRPTAIDPVNNPLPLGYADTFPELRKRLEMRGFSIEGVIRSPWWDAMCMRTRSTPKGMAQEYGRDYGGSMSRFFNIVTIDKMLMGENATAREPTFVGEIEFNIEDFKPRWAEREGGRLRLWCNLDVGNIPANEINYIVSADIATGAGGVMSSNSTFSVIIRETGIKVAEFASPSISPEDHAHYAIALCNFFHGPLGPAFLIWEENGPGSQFRRRVVDSDFRNFYYRSSTEEVARKRSKKPGWWSSNKSKALLLGEYNYALGNGDFTNPSKEALAECKQYQTTLGGKINHIASEKCDDPSGAGENHGDRVIADALGNWARKELGSNPSAQQAEKKEDDFPVGSFAWRRQQYNASKKATKDSW